MAHQFTEGLGWFSGTWAIGCEVTNSIAPSQVRVLLVTAMLSSAAGLILELLLVTQASYLAGNATVATGVVVGTFLAAMGEEYQALTRQRPNQRIRTLLKRIIGNVNRKHPETSLTNGVQNAIATALQKH